MHGSDRHRGVVSGPAGGSHGSSMTLVFLPALALAPLVATVFVSPGTLSAQLERSTTAPPES